MPAAASMRPERHLQHRAAAVGAHRTEGAVEGAFDVARVDEPFAVRADAAAQRREVARPASSSTGTRMRARLCSAIAALAVPTSTCTSTAWPRPLAIA